MRKLIVAFRNFAKAPKKRQGKEKATLHSNKTDGGYNKAVPYVQLYTRVNKNPSA